MSQPLPDAESRVEMSPNLRVTLQRAGSYAAEQSHRFVTIEHILLALNEDPDAELMLQACSIDQGQLHSDISGYLGLLEDRLAPGESAQPVLDPEAARIVNSAVIAAQKSRRNEVNGAIVLAAIIGDGRTSAANMLGAQGLTFQAAIEALQKSQNTTPPASNTGPAPLPHMQNPPMGNAGIPPAANQNPGPAQDEDGQATAHRRTTTEDVLADARRRVEAMREPVQQPAPPPAAAAPEPPPEPEVEEEAEPAPRPLQTEDSLARFERRAPPSMPPAVAPPQAAPNNPPAAAPPPQPDPVAAPPAGPPEPAPPPPVAAPATFGTEGLRRPPPPAPNPPPRRPPPPPEPRPAPTPPQPYGDRQGYAPPPPHEGGGYARSQLPVPVPEPPTSSGTLHPGQLVENIPRRMRMAVTEIVEVRIARAELQNLAKGMRNQSAAQQHELIITKAMSVRLRAPEGGFFVEPASPETQWIENQLGVLTDDFASWRWTVTPQRTGRSRLQLVVSARTVGGDGLAAETALPDQVFDVRVTTNYGLLAKRWGGWIAAAVVGGLLAKFGEQAWEIGQSMLRGGLGG